MAKPQARKTVVIGMLGTTIEVLPIVRIDEGTVGDGRPGPVARRLQAAFRRSVERWLAPQPV